MSQYFECIQAVGTGVTIVVGVIGFIRLKGQIKDGKRQIESLEKFAEQSKEQTEQLAFQLEQMKESNRIKTEELKLSEEQLNHTRKSTKLLEDKLEEKIKRRKIEIKPKFEKRGMQREPAQITLPIFNVGQTATICSIEELERNTMNSTLNHYVGKEILKDGKIDILFTPKPIGLNIGQCYAEVKLVYADIEGYKYSQIIEGKGSESLNIQKQAEILLLASDI